MEDLAAILTEQNVAVLNLSRTILKQIAEPRPDDWGRARVAISADDAEHAIFLLLNHASTWGDLPLTKAQVHNYTNAELAAQAVEAVEA